MNSTPPRFWYLLSEILVTLAPFRGDAASQPVDMASDIRRKVLALLWQLDSVLRNDLGDRDAYLVLFALVAHCDEIAQIHVQQARQQGWEPIQFQLFKLDNAGDLFFEHIDAFLYRNDIPPIVFEVYFFCLNDGFQGKYAAISDKLEEYRDNLRSRITVVTVTMPDAARHGHKASAYRLPVWAYYVACVSLILIVHYLLVLSASSLSFSVN